MFCFFKILLPSRIKEVNIRTLEPKTYINSLCTSMKTHFLFSANKDVKKYKFLEILCTDNANVRSTSYYVFKKSALNELSLL